MIKLSVIRPVKLQPNLQLKVHLLLEFSHSIPDFSTLTSDYHQYHLIVMTLRIWTLMCQWHPLFPNQNLNQVLSQKGLNQKCTRKYRCKMCKAGVNSAKELLDHHRNKHGIVYCLVCQKAFNNPLSLEHHKYSHKEKRLMCSNCNEGFQFMSQLRIHSVVHQHCAKHFCVYPGCYKKFKNKPDLNRHVKCHTSKEHKCPDCPYQTSDKRNFDLHRSSHSHTEQYFCDTCGKGFIYNTQKKRHLTKNACAGEKK